MPYCLGVIVLPDLGAKLLESEKLPDLGAKLLESEKLPDLGAKLLESNKCYWGDFAFQMVRPEGFEPPTPNFVG